MTPFLYKIAELFYAQYGNDLYRHTFVFPNRRAGFFFQKYLAEIAGKPLFSPSIITIQELFMSMSSYRLADKIEMLVMLYDHFGKISGSGESFDDFLYWGEMLLNDFNDVDKYMADARQLFRNVHDFRSMDDDLTHLTEKQKDAIRRFWTHFMPVGESETKKKFQETWQILYQLYTTFRTELQQKGLAYEGMMFREVAQSARSGELDVRKNVTNWQGTEKPAGKVEGFGKQDHSFESGEQRNPDQDGWQPGCYIFVGLNALTPAETVLLEHLKHRGIADFYWDYESPQVQDSQNRASLWVKENLRRFPSRFILQDSDGAGISSQPVGGNFSEDRGGESARVDLEEVGERNKQGEAKTHIEAIGIPSGVGQAKHVAQILSRLIESGNIPNPDEAINTAIVLPDERLLLPVLYSIPEEIGKINVTMGYGLSYSSIAALMEHIAGLQRNIRESAGEKMFYHRNVLSILNHPLVCISAKEEVEALKTYILANNRIVVSEGEFPPHPLFRLIFRPLTGWHDIFEYIKNILTFIYGILTDEKHHKEETGDTTRPVDLEREFIVQYHKTVTRLQDRLQNARNMSLETCFRLLKKLAHSITVAFSGEPLSGLQVMGVLETRVIDFENLIILSMNEGVFPLKDPVNSFIPFTLRKGFGLPVYEHQDGTYAYHFYRMISRAKRVFMLYDTRAEEMQTGEVSRYFYQLKYLYPDYFNISERVVAYDVAAPEILPVSVSKTPEVLRKLDAFRKGGESFLSASLINNYINCPLQFYFTAVEGLYQEDEVRESVESDLFGSIFHKLMETIYSRYKAKTVTPDVLTAIAKDDALLTRLLEEAFAEYYFKQKDEPRPLLGQHYLIGEILRSYVKQTLETDKQFTPFEFVAAEYRFGQGRPYRVNAELWVNFKGIIDRIDRVGDSYRIIDYKTGTGMTDFKQIADLFDGSKPNRPYQILQVFVYALFYAQEYPDARLSPAIYYLRSIFGDPSPAVTCNKRPISDISVFMDEFLPLFHNCLEEIFNPDIPFAQTKNTKNCQWCAFKELCSR
ncbi:PD-(D/E)XK nuclease family protein [Proteiniphilum sp. X52]|uniref:PD-(D/E)XK nuclease family protein n=1 Tax=Proteiniphilum sp. X52 TaxID=2382159 RepID=UPI0021016B84|nr:PD-(D/E)XK nuclease family protein [Proteiniphilum sp. X52]